MLFPTSSMDHMKFQSNWLLKKISKVKVYMKGTVGNDMFIRIVEPPLLVKFPKLTKKHCSEVFFAGLLFIFEK